MLDRLFSILVQEVPEELSFCEFDCAVTKCTVRDWKECSLLQGRGVAQSESRGVQGQAIPVAAFTR
ncbi:MAG TPA: hypothetical protein VM011_04925 [Gammaproteobacteria bacterium]|nr:hypothetical protein [Gammaproteobacteria bacterium]